MKRKRDVYEDIWNDVISTEIDYLSGQRGVSCENKDSAKERIWDAYCELNWHSAHTYLEKKDGLLDRHKVAACYIYAILSALPLDVDTIDPEANRGAYLSNERLAITVGISVLGMFDRAIVESLSSAWNRQGLSNAAAEKLQNEAFAMRDSPFLTPAEAAEVIELIDTGLDFPRRFPTPEGSYYDSVLVALCYTEIEDSYNVPLLALLLYHWEHALVGPKFHSLLLSIRSTTGDSMQDNI